MAVARTLMVEAGAAEAAGAAVTGAPDRLGEPEDGGGALDGGGSGAEVTGASWDEDMAGNPDIRLLWLER
jgi:hypothetical protein